MFRRALRASSASLGALARSAVARSAEASCTVSQAPTSLASSSASTFKWSTLESLAVHGSWASSVHVRTMAKTINASGMKVYKPTTPGFRGRIITDRTGLWKGRPFKPLTTGKRRISGRGKEGQITVRFRGGGHKRLYRTIDFKRPEMKEGLFGKVERVEYDPNRSARIALVKTPKDSSAFAEDDEVGGITGKEVADVSSFDWAYIIATEGMQPGAMITSGPEAPIKPGNTLKLMDIPAGTTIHNIELHPGRGGQMVRAAGASAVLVKKGDDGYSLIKLPSGEQRLVRSNCSATIGVVSNIKHKNRKLGKAGASRWLGRRPHNRGVSMNPVDHPHGGGRGKSKGKKHPVSPSGVLAKGKKTRKKTKYSDKYIRTTRHVAKAKR